MNEMNTIKLRTPSDLLRSTPQLLGYAPTDRLVVVAVRAGMLHVALSAPLEVMEQPDGPEWLLDRLSLAQSRSEDSLAESDFRVLLIGYGERDRALAAVWSMAAKIPDKLVGSFIVDGDRWWSADDGKAAPGRPVPTADDLPPISPRTPAASRDELVASLAAPAPGEQEDAMVLHLMKAVDEMPEDPAEAFKIVLSAITAWRNIEPVSDFQYVAAGAAMSSGETRDHLWRWLTRDRAVECLPFWKEVLRRTPRGARPVTLAVTGLHAWIAGEGAVLNICDEEASSTGSQNSLVKLVGQINAGALPPTVWEPMLNVLANEPE